MNSVTDTQWAAITGQPKINRAAQRRAQAAERAELIARLGMLPEVDGEDRYAATIGELRQWVKEAE